MKDSFDLGLGVTVAVDRRNKVKVCQWVKTLRILIIHSDCNFHLQNKNEDINKDHRDLRTDTHSFNKEGIF